MPWGLNIYVGFVDDIVEKTNAKRGMTCDIDRSYKPRNMILQ